MTDRRSGRTRRGFLALAGGTALAGCNALRSVTEDEPAKIDGGELDDALSAEPPTVAETIPVEVEQSYLDESADRARRLRSSVPAPFDAEGIPNGAIRAELSTLYEDATEKLDGALDAPSDAEAMARLRDARKSAQAVAAAWAAIDDGLTRADVRETATGVRADVDAFRRRWEYVGGRPIRAVLAHGQVEELVSFAANRTRYATERSRRGPEDPTTVGEFAGRIEETRAAAADAEYLFERYAESLDESRSIRSGLRTAGSELTATLDDRRAKLPDDDAEDVSSFVDRDVEKTPVASALTDLLRSVDYADGLEDERATGRRASVVLSVHETLVRIRAFETLRERASNGDHVTVETADDVRAIREGAFEAIEDAAESDDGLARRVLAQISGDFEYFDDRLGNYDDGDEVSVAWLDRELGRYVTVEAMARATPPVTADVTDVIRTHV